MPRSASGFLPAWSSFSPGHQVRFLWHPEWFIQAPPNRALPGSFYWVSMPLGRASLKAQMSHSLRFPWEMFCAHGPWLISYRKFLACFLHAERKLMAQKLCLVKEKDTGNDNKVPGWKTPAAPWGGRALVWQNGQDLHRIVGQEEFSWGVSGAPLSHWTWVCWSESDALDFYTSTGLSLQTAFLKMQLWICFLFSSSNHKSCFS